MVVCWTGTTHDHFPCWLLRYLPMSFERKELLDRDATLNRGDIDTIDEMRDVLDSGYNIGRADAYALLAEIVRLRAQLEEARASRNALIRQLGGRTP